MVEFININSVLLLIILPQLLSWLVAYFRIVCVYDGIDSFKFNSSKTDRIIVAFLIVPSLWALLVSTLLIYGVYVFIFHIIFTTYYILDFINYKQYQNLKYKLLWQD